MQLLSLLPVPTFLFWGHCLPLSHTVARKLVPKVIMHHREIKTYAQDSAKACPFHVELLAPFLVEERGSARISTSTLISFGGVRTDRGRPARPFLARSEIFAEAVLRNLPYILRTVEGCTLTFQSRRIRLATAAPLMPWQSHTITLAL